LPSYRKPRGALIAIFDPA